MLPVFLSAATQKLGLNNHNLILAECLEFREIIFGEVQETELVGGFGPGLMLAEAGEEVGGSRAKLNNLTVEPHHKL